MTRWETDGHAERMGATEIVDRGSTRTYKFEDGHNARDFHKYLKSNWCVPATMSWFKKSVTVTNVAEAIMREV